MEIYPCHGAGSACGKSIGDRTQTTIGNERLFNPALQDRSPEEFCGLAAERYARASPALRPAKKR